ncbi:MAG: RNA polymerase sigma factor (sigma-70 family) [Bradymonadia bacterium]|jgi:RNA polymerase sigma factor (sigma-70 family)
MISLTDERQARQRRMLQQAVAGDPRAQRQLIDAQAPAIYALLDRMLRPRGLSAQIDDVAQDTFIAVFAQLPRFDVDGAAKLSTWILTIASRRAIDAMRRAERRARRRWFAPKPRALAAPDSSLLGRQLAAIVGELPPDQHAVFVLRACHEFADAEIAGALDIPIGIVKSRLSRARARLKTALAEEPLHG